MGKGKKRAPSNRFPVIPKNGGRSWQQFMAQIKNVKKAKKESDEARKRTGK